MSIQKNKISSGLTKEDYTNPLKYPLSNPNDETLNSYDKKDQNDSRVQRVLDNDGELSAGEFNNLFSHLQDKRLEFIYGTKQDKALAIRDLNLKAQGVKQYKDFRQNLAAAYNSKALMNRWDNTQEGDAILSLLKDEPRLVEKTCPDDMNCPQKGEMGVIMPDWKSVTKAIKRSRQLTEMFKNIPNTEENKEAHTHYKKAMKELNNVINTRGEKWVSISNLNKMIKLKDTASKDVLKTIANNYLQYSTQINPADNMEFPQAAVEKTIRTTLIEKAKNLSSIVYDEMIDGRVMYDDLRKKIAATTPWGDDPMAVEAIANSLVHDPEHIGRLKNELTDYYTRYVRKQWDMGIANRANPTKKPKLKGIKKYRPGA